MAELRYSELKYNGQTYTEQWKIDEILIKNKFNWMVNAEIKNARLEIFENTLVWNAGIWYNGSWYFGVWRDGEWRYGTWQNGVWYNGVWRDGTFKSGIIYKGKFFKGKIESGEIRGGQFISMEIDPKVVEYTEDEYQVKKQEEQKEVQQAAVATAQPATPTNPDQVKVHSTLPAGQQQVTTQPKIQQEKKEYKMKKIRSFENYITEELYDPNAIESDEPILVDNIKQIELSNKLKELLNKTKTIVCKYNNSENCNISDSDDAIELLSDIEKEHELYDDADELISEIIELVDEIELKNNN